MAKFELPEHPLSNKDNPFVDKDGNNPFADKDSDQQTDPAETLNERDAFAPSHAASDRALRDQPGQYEDFLTDRAHIVLPVGLVSMLVNLAGGIANVYEQYHLNVPFMVCGCAGCVAAIMIGRADLRAMNAGAMRTDRRGRIRAGILYSLIGLLVFVLGIVWIVATIWQASWAA